MSWLKTAQNVALSLFGQNKCITLTVEKSSPAMRATSENFKKLFGANNHLLGEHSPNLVTLVPAEEQKNQNNLALRSVSSEVCS
jgi:hypothetical protein